MATKAPLIKKTESKKAEPPLALPFEQQERQAQNLNQVTQESPAGEAEEFTAEDQTYKSDTADEQKAPAPDDLPTV